MYDLLDDEKDNKMIVYKKYDETKIQMQNKILLKSLANELKDNMRVFTADMAQSIFKQCKKRRVDPVLKFRGQLEITPNLYFDVCVYEKTMEKKLPRLKKYSLNVNFSDDINIGNIINKKVYYENDDPNKNPISDEKIIEAYNYGKSLVSIDKNVDLILNLNSNLVEKELQAIGFTDSSKVPSKNFIIK